MALAMGFLTAALVATVVAATTSPTVGASATTTLTCTAALSAACQPEKSNGVFTCAQCAGVHQHELQAAGCSNDDIAAWCAGVTPHSRSQFPGSKLITSTDLAATLNGWASLDVLQEWVRCYSSFENASHPSAFHQGCDSYATTLIVARNGLNQTFGGYATRTWNKDACCRDPANHCVPMGSRCTQYDATSDFVFGLAPGKPVRYAPTPEAQTYQVVYRDYWPQFGESDAPAIYFGMDGELGFVGFCMEGHTYAPSATGRTATQYRDMCGGDRPWGPTQMEAWRPQ